MTTTLRDQPADIIMADVPTEAADKSKTRLPVGSYLFTPPENTVDSFSQADDSQYPEQAVVDWRKSTQLQPLVQTPPASPEFTDNLPDIATATGLPARDAPLFPEQTQSDRAREQVPLFEKEPSPSPSPTQSSKSYAQALERESTTPSPPASSTKASRSGSFPFNQNWNGQQILRYYHSCVEENRQVGMRELPLPKKSTSVDLDQESRRQLQSLNRVSKSRPTARAVARPKATAPAPPVQPSPPKPKRTPKVKTMDQFYGSAFPQKESATKHKRAPPSKKVEGENVNWTELPDYAPPTSDLDSNNKVLLVHWHGHPLPDGDLGPDRVHLHEQEIQVALKLRLNAATYLTNKRKIFQAKLQSKHDGKNFTKTAAQSACKIDVNKASQLWEAFNKVKWFDDEWFEPYLSTMDDRHDSHSPLN